LDRRDDDGEAQRLHGHPLYAILANVNMRWGKPGEPKLCPRDR
jgi:hypothetical protein